MRTCGIDLKGNEAIIVSLEGSAAQYHQIGGTVKKIKLKDPNDQNEVQFFFKSLSSYVREQRCDQIGIKERASKGKFAGGPTSFKMEGLIQLVDCPVAIIHARTIQAKLKSADIDIAGFNQYQLDALRIAYYLFEGIA